MAADSWGMAHLILGDIHANREALEAVLVHVQGRYDQNDRCPGRRPRQLAPEDETGAT